MTSYTPAISLRLRRLLCLPERLKYLSAANGTSPLAADSRRLLHQVEVGREVQGQV